MKPGEIITTNSEITLNQDRNSITIKVANTVKIQMTISIELNLIDT